MYNNKRYTVTEIFCPRREVREYKNVETDKRKKERFEWVTVRSNWRWNLLGNPVSYKSYQEDKIVESIIIPDTVRLISENAFNSMTRLRSVKIPESVVEIGESAFAFCYSLKEIYIPNSVKFIRERAFLDSGLTTLSIPPSVENITVWAFAGTNLEEVSINADPFEIMIAISAFPRNAKITYLGRPQKTEQEKEEKQIDLDKLIDAVVIDGVVTEKERAVILKKATAAGYDADEIEILLDARLHEKQTAQKETEKTITDQKTEEKTTAQEPVVSPKKSSKQVANEVDEEFSFGAKLWEPVKAELLKHMKMKVNIPKGRSYMGVPSVANKGNVAVWISYGVRESTAYVALETYGGEEMKSKISRAIASLPDTHLLKHAELSQGKRNKNKWAWGIKHSIDKADAGLVQWYADKLLSLCTVMEEMTLS